MTNSCMNLEERAIANFRDNLRMQELWIDAVNKLRTTGRGWVMDNYITKCSAMDDEDINGAREIAS